ncbi:15626_t:CDS:1, partial [Dentiscutata heterogama]
MISDLEKSLEHIGKLRHKLESNRLMELPKHYKHRESIISKNRCFKNLQASSLLSFMLAQLMDEVDRAAKYWEYRPKEIECDNDTSNLHDNIFEIDELSFYPENVFRWLKRFKSSSKSTFRAIIKEQVSILYGVGDTIEHIVMLQTHLRNGIDPFSEVEKKKPTQDDVDIWLIMVYTTSKLLEKLENEITKIEEPSICFIYKQLVNDLEPFLITIQKIAVDKRWKESELIEDNLHDKLVEHKDSQYTHDKKFEECNPKYSYDEVSEGYKPEYTHDEAKKFPNMFSF